MNSSKSRIILEEQKNNFSYKKDKSNLNITFNRIAFIFYFFYNFFNLFYSSYTSWLKKK